MQGLCSLCFFILQTRCLTVCSACIAGQDTLCSPQPSNRPEFPITLPGPSASFVPLTPQVNPSRCTFWIQTIQSRVYTSASSLIHFSHPGHHTPARITPGPVTTIRDSPSAPESTEVLQTCFPCLTCFSCRNHNKGYYPQTLLHLHLVTDPGTSLTVPPSCDMYSLLRSGSITSYLFF